MSRTIRDLSVWNKTLIDKCQYCSTSRANQALRSLANAGFQNRGVCLQAFPSFPSVSPLFHFLSVVSFLARPKPPSPPCSCTYNIFRTAFDSRFSFFALKPHGNAFYAGYVTSRVSDFQHGEQKGSSKRRIIISILPRKYCSDFLDLETLRFLFS